MSARPMPTMHAAYERLAWLAQGELRGVAQLLGSAATRTLSTDAQRLLRTAQHECLAIEERLNAILYTDEKRPSYTCPEGHPCTSSGDCVHWDYEA